jgi:hypothetical protein
MVLADTVDAAIAMAKRTIQILLGFMGDALSDECKNG